MITCDNCKLTIPPGNVLYDVSMSGPTEVPPANIEGDELDNYLYDKYCPEYEVILCSECWAQVKGLP